MTGMSDGKRPASADRLRELLAASGDPLRLYLNETMYHVQIDYTCQLLDVVDEVTDTVTAGMITDLIYERLSGDGASKAAQRIRDARVAVERLSRETVPLWPPRTSRPR